MHSDDTLRKLGACRAVDAPTRFGIGARVHPHSWDQGCRVFPTADGAFSVEAAQLRLFDPVADYLLMQVTDR
jgi:hypothetical protein